MKTRTLAHYSATARKGAAVRRRMAEARAALLRGKEGLDVAVKTQTPDSSPQESKD